MSTPVPLRVALAGLGTVGGGVAELLRRNAEIISQRAGRPVQLVAVADLDQAKAKGLTGPNSQAFSDALEMLAAVKPDVLIELIGGYGYAKTLVLGAIEAGVHVVTANKALLAVHGNEIFPLAEARGVQVGFEASVAGGIPIIKALREGLAANEIESVAGIINGTTNFILSEMRDKGLGFDEVLAQAQKLGYAEADPTSMSRAWMRPTKLHCSRPLRLVCRWRLIVRMSKAFADSPPSTFAMPRNWATESSSWASRAVAPKGWSFGSIPRWYPPSAFWPMSRGP